jgi:hypothetical protein
VSKTSLKLDFGAFVLGQSEGTRYCLGILGALVLLGLLGLLHFTIKDAQLCLPAGLDPPHGQKLPEFFKTQPSPTDLISGLLSDPFADRIGILTH